MLSLDNNISIFLIILLYILFLLSYSKCFSAKFWERTKLYKSERSSKPIIFLLFFCIFAVYSGDYYHYIDWVKEANVNFKINYNHLKIEVAYQILSSIINGEYILFRLVVWGGAILLNIATAKNLKLNSNLFFLLILFIYLPTYSYARATLAMSLFFYGTSFFVGSPKTSLFVRYVLGFFFMGLSYYFHKSMIILLALTPILFQPRFKSKTINIAIYILLTIFVFILLNNALYNTDIINNLGDEGLSHKYETYSSRSIIRNIGFSERIQIFLTNLCVYGSLFIIIIKYNYKKKNDAVFHFLTFAFLLLLLAFILPYYNTIFNSVATRIKNMAMIPITFILVDLIQNGRIAPKIFKYLVILGVIQTLYKFLYFYYCSFYA